MSRDRKIKKDLGSMSGAELVRYFMLRGSPQAKPAAAKKAAPKRAAVRRSAPAIEPVPVASSIALPPLLPVLVPPAVQEEAPEPPPPEAPNPPSSPPVEPPALPKSEPPASDEVEVPSTEEDPDAPAMDAASSSPAEEAAVEEVDPRVERNCSRCGTLFLTPYRAPNRTRCRLDFDMMLQEAFDGIMRIRRRKEKKRMKELAEAAKAAEATGEGSQPAVRLRQDPRDRPQHLSARHALAALEKPLAPPHRNIETAPQRVGLGDPTPAEKYLGKSDKTSTELGQVSATRLMPQHKLF